MARVQIGQRIDEGVIGAVAADGNDARDAGRVGRVNVRRDFVWMLGDGDNQLAELLPQQRLQLRPDVPGSTTTGMGIEDDERGHALTSNIWRGG